MPAADAQAMWDAFNATLEDANQAAQSYKPNKADWLEGHWAGLSSRPTQEIDRHEDATAVADAVLKQVGTALARVPAGFALNPKIARQLEAKQAMIDTGEGIDWATGEALAFGTLLLEGYRVRLSGEDCQRGTFSQRHAVLIDQANQNEYVPLNNIAARPGEDRDLQLAAVGGRRAGLRVRLHAGRSADAGAVGRRSSATSPTARR